MIATERMMTGWLQVSVRVRFSKWVAVSGVLELFRAPKGCVGDRASRCSLGHRECQGVLSPNPLHEEYAFNRNKEVTGDKF